MFMPKCDYFYIYTKKSHGFGLIEVMIAASILTVSLLGVAAIQSRAINASNQASVRETAVRLLSQISTFIINMESNELSSLFSTATQDCIKYNSTALSCTRNQLFTAITNNWKNNISRILPGGEGCFCIVGSTSSSAPSIIFVRSAVRWTDLSGVRTTNAIDSKFFGSAPSNANACPSSDANSCFSS